MRRGNVVSFETHIGLNVRLAEQIMLFVSFVEVGINFYVLLVILINYESIHLLFLAR